MMVDLVYRFGYLLSSSSPTFVSNSFGMFSVTSSSLHSYNTPCTLNFISRGLSPLSNAFFTSIRHTSAKDSFQSSMNASAWASVLNRLWQAPEILLIGSNAPVLPLDYVSNLINNLAVEDRTTRRSVCQDLLRRPPRNMPYYFSPVWCLPYS